MHGVGSHEQDLIGLAPYLDGRYFYISARAPIPLGYGGYAWFNLQFTPTGPVMTDPREHENSRQTILRFIAESVERYGLDATRVYLLGFSQGAIMSLSLAMSQPDKLAGVVALSGRTAPEVKPLLAPAEKLSGFPILVTHGTEDEVLPIVHGRATRDLLATLPVALTYREYPMGHQISPECLADVAEWLTNQLDETST